MKKINYAKAVAGSFNQLLKDPEGFAAKLGITLVAGKYLSAPSRIRMTEALTMWAGMNPSSAFYDEVGNRMRRKHSFSWSEYYVARDAYANELLAQMAVSGTSDTNEYVRIVCMFMSLPNEVARKWLWYENVDFQSCESFLRRLTQPQYESLVLHYNLVNDGVPVNKLPCFTEGVLNKVWNLFNIAFKRVDRMSAKSALAHDFLGMGMGFSLYPDAVVDKQANQNVASQFLSKQDRGAFEVNKEHGGLYWFLYHKLRSNALYREDEEVELGRWICPGFWFTMIAWGVLAIASPVSLIAAVSLLALKGVVSMTLFSLGSILPGIAFLVWARKIGRRTYDKEYWKWLSVMAGIFWVVLILHLIITEAKNSPVFYLGVLCGILLLPYCIKEDTWKFWRAPILGKILPLIFLSAGVLEIYANTEFFEFCWSVIQSIGGFLYSVAMSLYEMRVVIITWALLVVGYASMIIGLFHFSNWAMKKIDTMIERGDQRVYQYERAVNWGVIGMLVAFVLVSISIAPHYNLEGTARLILLCLVALPFLSFLVANLLFRGVAPQANQKVYHNALTGTWQLSLEQMGAVREAIAGNDFWTDIVHAGSRAKALNRVIYRVSGYHESCLEWVIAMIRLIRSDKELNNAVRFVAVSIEVFLYHNVTPKVLRLILDGASEEIINKAAGEEEGKKRSAQGSGKPSLWANLSRLSGNAWSEFLVFLYSLTWPVRALWKGARDLYRLWEVFNEQCPQAPSNDRPVAR